MLELTDRQVMDLPRPYPPGATPLPRLGCGGPSQMNDDQSTGTPQVGLCIDDTSKPAISPHQQEHDVKIDPGPSTMTEA